MVNVKRMTGSKQLSRLALKVLGAGQPMKRGCTLPGGCKNLGDKIRVLAPEGTDWGFMTVAEAQSHATALHAELIMLARGRGTQVFKLVDTVLRKRLRRKKM